MYSPLPLAKSFSSKVFCEVAPVAAAVFDYDDYDNCDICNARRAKLLPRRNPALYVRHITL
jgi:hypothetical protein